MKQQLATSGEGEDFIAVFYGGEADESVSASKREAVLLQPVLAPSMMPRNQDCAEALQKYPVVHYSSCG